MVNEGVDDEGRFAFVYGYKDRDPVHFFIWDNKREILHGPYTNKVSGSRSKFLVISEYSWIEKDMELYVSFTNKEKICIGGFENDKLTLNFI